MIKFKSKHFPNCYTYVRGGAITAIEQPDHNWSRIRVDGTWIDVDHTPQQILEAISRSNEKLDRGEPVSLFEAVFGKSR